MGIQHVNLLVLRCADLDRSLVFYEQLGLTFVEERHGNGPVHYAATLGELVIELYPGKPGEAPPRFQSGATTIGFAVTSLDAMVVAIREHNTVITEPTSTDWGRRAVVLDPDGRMLDLTEQVADTVTSEEP